MACEVFIEQSFTVIFRHRGVQYLEKAVEELLPSHNLNNHRVRSLYVALTGDRIQDAPFWPAFAEASALRNRLVHQGERATLEHAKNACDAVRNLTQHVTDVLKAISPS
jgi:hypothetical protein